MKNFSFFSLDIYHEIDKNKNRDIIKNGGRWKLKI